MEHSGSATKNEMGKIMLYTDKSKPVRAERLPAAAVILCLSALLIVTGCGDGGSPDKNDAAPPPLFVSSDPDLRPVITSDMTAANAWLGIAREIAAGDSIGESTFAELLDTPAYKMIDDDTNQKNLSPRVMKRIMDYVFTHQDTTDTIVPRRKSLLDSQLYLRDHLDAVAAINRDIFSTENLNDLRDVLTRYAPAEEWPPTITIEFMANQPLINFREPNRFAIDVGLAVASGSEQTAGILAGRMYDVLAKVDGIRPIATEDRAVKLVGAFCMLRHGAISAWLNDKPNIAFDDEHDLLRNDRVGEAAMIVDANKILTRTFNTLSNMLDPLLDHNVERFGARIDVLYQFNDRYEKTGWAMARLIVEHYGERRLQEVAGDTAEFLKTYQTAALADGNSDELDRLPPFPEAVLEDLLTLLARY